jgi:hypothetical protein
MMAIETTPFNVEQFRASLGGGGARSNQFLVQLTFPQYVQQGTQATAAAPFLVSAASLPQSQINQAMLYYRGREVKLGGERIFAPWSITVINDLNMTLRSAFEDWQNGINNLQDNSGYEDPTMYYQDFTVTQLDRNSNPLKAYAIRGAFPLDVAPISLDFGVNDQISNFNVTFALQDFTTMFDGTPDDGSSNNPTNSQSTITS